MYARRAFALMMMIVVAALSNGCGHEIESPAAKAGAVTPNLVCVEQLTTTVTLVGDGFTPMPSKLLEEPPTLLLPKIDLTQTQALDGSSASGKPAAVPDDPARPGDSQVHWTSEKQMSFRFTPALVGPGLYDIVVTNPDGVHSARFTNGLLGVPRPTLVSPVPDILCNAQEERMVTLEGRDILRVGATLPTVQMGDQVFTASEVGGCTALPGNDATRDASTCTSATFVIPRGAFMPGEYDVTLTNPAPADCTSSDPIRITVVPPPTVSAIAPDIECVAQGDQTMSITGTGFLQIGAALPTILVGTQMFQPTTISGCTPVPGMFQEGMVSSCTELGFVIPMGAFPEGDYPVSVENPPPAGCASVEALDLHIAPPPSIGAVSPLGICDDQGDQVLTIDGSGFLDIGGALPTVTISDAGGSTTITPTGATGCVPVTGMFVEGVVQTCTGLTLTVPQSTFAAGTYNVVVTNPPPADCSSTETVSVDVHDPPIVTGTVPATLCQGGGSISIQGQGFQQGATVTLESMNQGSIASIGTMVDPGGTQIDATFGGGAIPGTVYDVVVDNGDGCTDAPPHQQVTIVTGPVAFFADPEVVFNGINTRVTVYVTTLQQPLPANAVTIVPAGMTTPVTQLQFNTVAGHPNRVQAIVPEGQAAGVYDLRVNDATGCSTILPSAITVTGTLSVAVKSVIPPFGYDAEPTAVTVLRDKMAPAGMQTPFIATPRLFLNPTSPLPTDVAIQVQSVSFVDQDTLTAVVPKNQPVHAYDLIVVNPDGTVGYLANAFVVQAVPPPTVAAVTPSSIVAAAGQSVVVSGKNFSGSTITVTCQSGGNTVSPPVTSGPVNCPGPGVDCTQSAVIDASGLAAGAVCILRITNADGSYFDYSAIGVTNSSLNLSLPKAGSDLQVGRRALVAAAADATTSARFVYAIGGDGGPAMAATPFSSTELASVDLFGNMGAWSLQPASTLATARAFAGSATIGRYLYVFGGTDGANALASAERAMILNPSEVPLLDIDDIVPADTGLDPGYWLYRVSATFTAGDPENPSGESLPSDEFIVKVPTVVGKKIQVVLSWSAPADALGAPLPNVAGYNVYRTPMVDGTSGGEVLLATAPAGTLKYTDDGSATPGTQQVLSLGSTGKWAQLPAMGAVRIGPAGAAVVDPGSPDTFYVYALLGKAQAATALTTHEFLTVTIQPNGHQTVSAGWTPGTQSSGTGRWQHGAWVVDGTVQSNYAGESWIFLGGGLNGAGTQTGVVDAAQVQAGGQLGAFDDVGVKDFTTTAAGYGVCAANQQLFFFGGLGAAPSAGARSAGLFASNNPSLPNPPPGLANNGWNSGISLTTPRYLLGSAVQSAFIFLVAGQTNASPASTTTELVIW